MLHSVFLEFHICSSLPSIIPQNEYKKCIFEEDDYNDLTLTILTIDQNCYKRPVIDICVDSK